MHNENYYINIDILGKMYIKDMIIFYDMPLVFSCYNDFGNYFIANCSDEDQDKIEWLFLPISQAKLINGLKGNISAYDLFKYPEGDFLWRVTQYSDQSIAKAVQINPKNLADEDLPDKRALYHVINEELLPSRDSKISKQSIDERREIIDISIEPHDSHYHEIDCETLGKTLKEIQSIINFIAHKTDSTSRNIPESIKKDNKLNVVGTFAASFGVRLKSDTLSDILGYSKLQENVKTFMDLIDMKENTDSIKELLNTLNPIVAIKYGKLLKVLSGINAGLKVDCAFPNKYKRNIHITCNEIRNNLDLLGSEIKNQTRVIELMGQLVGANVENKSFDFISNDGSKINGTIGENVNVDEYRLPKDAEIVIEESVETNEYMNREVIKYKLLDLKYFDKK